MLQLSAGILLVDAPYEPGDTVTVELSAEVPPGDGWSVLSVCEAVQEGSAVVLHTEVGPVPLVLDKPEVLPQGVQIFHRSLPAETHEGAQVADPNGSGRPCREFTPEEIRAMCPGGFR